MIEIASKMVLCLVIAALIGFLIGLLVGRLTRENNKSSIYKHNHDFKVHGNIYNRPIILSKPRPTGRDDLKQIEGINLKTEEDLNAILIANFKRAQESSRVLEEFTKLHDAKISEIFKAIRYELYDIEINLIQ